MKADNGKVLVLVDGTAASDKSTAAALLAENRGYQHINSGLLYRATGLIAHERSITFTAAAEGLSVDDLARHDLDTEFVGSLASSAAKNSEVRIAINEAIRRMIALGTSGTVMCGRAGFAEFPEAAMKIYITASDEECTRRRFLQLHKKGKWMLFEDLMRKIQERNHEDHIRPVAPMRRFEEAILLYDDAFDNTTMQVEETLERILKTARLRLPD